MSQIISGFITELAVHFGRKHDNQEAEDAWLGSMLKALRGFDGPTLSAAAEWFINNRSERSFPMPAECRDVCDKAASRQAIQKKASELPVGPPAPFSDAGVKLADDLIQRASISKEAAREGWILALHEHCIQQGMLPTSRETDKCKQVTKRFDENYADSVRRLSFDPAQERVGTFVGLAGLSVTAALVRLGDSMIARREELRARILGRAA